MHEFLGYREFVKNRHEIKRQFDKMTREQRRRYKCYDYSNSLISEDKKDLIWEYLNNDISNKKLKSVKVRV